MPKSSARPKRIPAACRECGVVLDRDDRAYCDECLQAFEDQRTAKLVHAAKRVLAEMRGSKRDPAQSVAAKAKRSATVALRMREAKNWERDHPGPHDPETFRRKVAPRLGELTLPQMMKATGLTSAYCLKIRRGERIPHPRHWEVLRALAINLEGSRIEGFRGRDEFRI